MQRSSAHQRVRTRAAVVVLAVLVGAQSVAAAACIDAARPVRTVVLGDSYSAGNGAGSYRGAEGCFRSSNNYGSKFVDGVRAEGIATAAPVVAACSGATTAEVLNESTRSSNWVRVRYERLTPPSGSTVTSDLALLCSRLYSTDVDEFARRNGSASLDIFNSLATSVTTFKFVYVYAGECERRAHAQIDSLTSQTDVVLLTLGGNDVGFSDIVVNCFVDNETNPLGGTCAGKLDKASALVSNPEGLRKKLKDALTAVRDRVSASSRVVLVGYPYLDDGSYVSQVCLPLTIRICGPRSPTGKIIRDLGDLGDQAQRAVADELNGDGSGGAKIEFSSGTKALFAGHEPNGSRVVSNPDGWLWELPDVRTFREEYYHPKAVGHAAIADALVTLELLWLLSLTCVGSPTVVTFDVSPSWYPSLAANRPVRVKVGGVVVFSGTASPAGTVELPVTVRSTDATVELDTTVGVNCGGSYTHRWEHQRLTGEPIWLTDDVTRRACT